MGLLSPPCASLGLLRKVVASASPSSWCSPARISFKPASLSSSSSAFSPAPVIFPHQHHHHHHRAFHTTRPAAVRAGDELPADVPALAEDSPGNHQNLAEWARRCRRVLVIGVPGAFSGACSSRHVPSYMQHPGTAEFEAVAVVSVNDVFVMKAWKDALDPVGETGIRFLADPTGAFTKALDLDFDATAVFGNARSKRYAMTIEDGKVKSVHVEPDNTGTNVSMADKVLG